MSVVHTESEKESSSKYVKKTAVRLKIKCRIEKFETLMDSTEPGEGELCSEGVSSKLVPRAIWMLEICPNGWLDENKGNISVYLNLTRPMADNQERLGASFHFYLIDGTGDRIDIDGDGSGIHEFGEKEGYGWGWDASHDQVRKTLHADGSLVVAADIDFFVPDDGALQCDADLQQWPAKFSELHGDQASSDCTIKIGGMSIPAHKSFLMAQSPIFRSMFTNSLAEECKSGVVKVTDFTQPEPMRALVRYCYQGYLDEATMDGEGAVEIFKLADHYFIAGLKGQLEKRFADNRLSVENVVAMAVLADTYTAPELKEACIELIAEEGDAVFESADWKKLRERDPKLTTDLAIAAYHEK